MIVNAPATIARNTFIGNLIPGDLSQFGGYGVLSIADPIFDLAFLFSSGGQLPECESACDANDDGLRNIADPITTLFHLFSSGPAPPDPGPLQCGPDPTPDSIGCGGPPCA